MTPAASDQEDSPALKRLHFGAFLALGAIGLYATSFGPALDTIADDLDISLDTAGLILTLLFTGSICASGLLAFRLRDGNSKSHTLSGLVLLALAMLGLAFVPSWPLAMAVAVLMGVGDGLIAAGTHELVARTAARPAQAVNRLNLWFAIGAFAGPLWAGGALAAGFGRPVVYTGLALVMLACAAVLATAHWPGGRAGHGTPAAFGFRQSPALWLMGGLLFVYVGAEIGLGAWVASYAREEAGAGIMAGAIVTALYWGALGLGRLWSGALLGRGWAPERVLVFAIAPAIVTSATLAFAGETLVLGAAAAFLTGFFFGPIWPAAVASAARMTSAGAPALLVTLGNAGGILFPWLQGRILVDAGPQTGIAMTTVLSVAMLVVAGVALRPDQRSIDFNRRRRADG